MSLQSQNMQDPGSPDVLANARERGALYVYTLEVRHCRTDCACRFSQISSVDAHSMALLQYSHDREFISKILRLDGWHDEVAPIRYRTTTVPLTMAR